MLNVYDRKGQIVARVQEHQNLDYWDGNNFTNGGTGKHRGLTKLKDGRFVLVHTSQWTGSKDFGEIITAEEALQEILNSNNLELLEKFVDLNKLYEDSILEQ
jgi:hypothetical protein